MRLCLWVQIAFLLVLFFSELLWCHNPNSQFRTSVEQNSHTIIWLAKDNTKMDRDLLAVTAQSLDRNICLLQLAKNFFPSACFKLDRLSIYGVKLQKRQLDNLLAIKCEDYIKKRVTISQLIAHQKHSRLNEKCNSMFNEYRAILQYKKIGKEEYF